MDANEIDTLHQLAIQYSTTLQGQDIIFGLMLAGCIVAESIEDKKLRIEKDES